MIELTIGTGVTILIAVFTAWINVKVKIAELEVKIMQLEKNFDNENISNSEEFKKMDRNFVKVFEGLTEIKIALQNKVDRK